MYTPHVLRYAGCCPEVKQTIKLSTEVTYVKTHPCYLFLHHFKIDRFISGIYLFAVYLKILSASGTTGHRKAEWLEDSSLMRCWKVQSWINLKYCAVICMAGLINTRINLNQCMYINHGYSHTTARPIGIYQMRCTAYKVAPDDGPIQSETCGASNGK